MIAISNIDTSIIGLKFKLKFKNELTLVNGDSGVGKTLLFKALMQHTAIYKNPIVFINYCMVLGDTGRIKDYLKASKNKLIVIDNADVLLTKELRVNIAMDASNQYLIFGRDVRGLGINERSIANLEIKDSIGKLKYKYVE